MINEKRSNSDTEGKRERNDRIFLKRRSTGKAICNEYNGKVGEGRN